MMNFVALVALIVGGTAHAGESKQWLIRGSDSQMKSFLAEQGLVAKPVFSPNERKFLVKKKRAAMATTRRLTLKNASEAMRLKNVIRSRGLKLSLQSDFLVRARSVRGSRASQADKLKDEQWALKNSGKSHSVYIDDFRSKVIQGIVGEDVKLPPSSKKGAGIVVATIDTGLDLNHPDLKNQIAYKPGECRALEAWRKCLETEDRDACDEKLGKTDTDGNGYPMDCHGWNMTGDENEITGAFGDPEMEDPADIAHGSHVAGIIAAEADNGIGVAGIAPHAKILPIRVITTQIGVGDGTVAAHDDATSMISLVVRGMLYAISSKANVINLSLGWDRIANELTVNPETEIPFMQEAVDLARSEGILVVASAGNDSTDALVYPCQHRGVLCVAAHSADGKISDLSNYGSGVEIAAPGLHILSTMPLDYHGEVFTDYKGYDFLSGTSMSAPYVAGAAAILMGEGYSADETFVRLITGARKRPLVDSKLVLSGNLDVSGALAVSPRPYYAPSNKGATYALWDLSASSFKLKFKIRNLWKTSQGARLRLGSADAPALARLYEIRQKSLSTGTWNKDEEKEFVIDIDVLDRRVSSELNLFVEISDVSGFTQSIRVPFIVSTKITSDGGHPALEKVMIKGGERLADATLYSIASLDGSDASDFIAVAGTAREWKIQLLTERNGEYSFGPIRKIPAMKNAGIRFRARMDVNFDGKSEYVLIFARDGERPRSGTPRNSGSNSGPARAPTWFEMYYLDDQGADVLPSFTYKNQVVDMDLDNLSWIKVGSRLTPAWVRVGTTPAVELDQPYDPWNPKPEDRPDTRFYYHDPATEDGLRSLSAPKKSYFEGVFKQSLEQRLKGEVDVLLYNSRDYVTTYFTARVSEGAKLSTPTQVRMRDYRNLRQIPSVKLLNLQAADRVVLAVAGASGVADQRITAVFNDGVFDSRDQTVLPGDVSDFAYKVMGAYFDETTQSISSYSQANYNFIYQDHTNSKPVETSLRKYSLLPNSMFIRLFMPVVAETQGQRVGGIFIADSFGAYVGSEVIVPLRDSAGRTVALTRPASLRFYVPQAREPSLQCEWMEPRPATEAAPSHAIYFCGDRVLRIPYRF